MTQTERLTRVLGTFGLAASIVNITIGGGIFRLPASVAGSLGAAAPVAYLVCAVAMGLIVWCIAEAGKRVTLTGGPYAYVGTAFGPYAGFVSGLMLWMLGTFAVAAVSTVFASAVGLLIPALGGTAAKTVVLAMVFAFWTVINMLGVGLAARLNTIATVAKLAPLVLIGVGGLFFVRMENLAWTAAPAATDVARTSLLLIFAFAGVECALVPSGEVRDPARTVPRAIAVAMLGITALYLALQVSAQGILGAGLATSTSAPLAEAAGASFGGWARTLLLVGAAVSMFGYLGGMAFSIPRMLYAFAVDGYLPRALAAVGATSHAPSTAVAVQSVIAFALAVSGTFEWLAVLANVSALFLYFGCALASWKLGTGGAGAVIPWITCAVIAWLLTGLTQSEWIGFGVCLAAGSAIYALRRARTANT